MARSVGTRSALLASVTRRLPARLPQSRWLQQALLDRYVGRRSRVMNAGVRGFEMSLDTFEFVDCALAFFPQLYDPEELAYMARHLRAGDVFVDAGAHIGLYSLVASRMVGSQGRVIAIEPDRENHRRLMGHLGRNGVRNVQALQIGLSDKQETLELRQIGAGNRAAGSFLNPPGPGEPVTCMPLLQLLQEQKVEHVHGMKLDIEGFEYRVMSRFLADAPADLHPDFLVVEFHPDWVELMGGDIIALLQRHGYRVVLTHALNYVMRQDTCGSGRVMREKRVPLLGSELVLRLNGDRTTQGSSPTPRTPDVAVFLPRPPRLPEDTPEQRAIVAEVRSTDWYHTIELGRGVRTPGHFDHTPALEHIPLPERLEGRRCLDLATLDGFYAFEMERRGAAEVVALDIATWQDLDLPPHMLERFKQQGIDGPTGRGFEIAARYRNSKVDRRICNLYDLSPERLGRFDLVVCADVLVHLRNPLRVMQNVHAVTRGEAIFIEPYIPGSAGAGPFVSLFAKLEDCRWWLFGKDFMSHALRSAGFSEVELFSEFDLRLRGAVESPAPRAILRARP